MIVDSRFYRNVRLAILLYRLESRAHHLVVRLQLGFHLLGADDHGAQLVAAEQSAVLSGPGQREQHRPRRAELDHERDDRKGYGQHDQGRRRQDHIHRPFDRVRESQRGVPTMSGVSDLQFAVTTTFKCNRLRIR